MKKRLLSVALALALALSLVPVGFAAKTQDTIVNPAYTYLGAGVYDDVYILEVTVPDDGTIWPYPFLNVTNVGEGGRNNLYDVDAIKVFETGENKGKFSGVKPGEADYMVDFRVGGSPGGEDGTYCIANIRIYVIPAAEYYASHMLPADAIPSTGTNPGTGSNTNTSTTPKPPVSASGTPISKSTNSGAVKSGNINAQAYVGSANPVKSYLFQNKNGGLTRVEYVDKKVVVEDYDNSFKLLSSWSTQPELPKWGGFFAGENYNFMIFGQDNPSESSSAEVIRVVQYTKDWKRIKSASLYGADTKEPFNSGSLRCDEYGGYLYIRTCHTMFNHSDGLNHQANFMFAIRQSDMTITDSFSMGGNDYGYVSHSFNQFVIVNKDGQVVTLDHGDTFPRGIVFTKYSGNAATGKFQAPVSSCDVIFKFAGAMGNVSTGASIGGLAETSDCYIFAYTYDGSGGRGAPLDSYAYYHYMDKASGENRSIKVSQTPGATTPVLAPTGLDGGYMLWTSMVRGNSGWTLPSHEVNYLHYSANGQTEPSKTVKGELSDCQPISYQGKVVWYVTNGSVPVFYILDDSGLKVIDTAPTEEQKPTTTQNPSNPQQPGASTQNPGTSTQNPGTNTQNPGTSTQKPGTNTQNPGTSTQKPGTNTQNPGTSTQNPGTSSQNPGTSKQIFSDVPAGAFFTEPVTWAIEKEVTNGTTSTTFSPYEECTQVQILTFLWRAAGKPSSDTALPISITGKNIDYAEGALRWAAENKMIDRSFVPNTPCTRASAVTYIWQAFGSPTTVTWSASSGWGGSNFTDVPANSTLADAISWAVAEEVTNGTSTTTFSPNDICNRGQIVTFLYRAYH